MPESKSGTIAACLCLSTFDGNLWNGRTKVTIINRSDLRLSLQFCGSSGESVGFRRPSVARTPEPGITNLRPKHFRAISRQLETRRDTLSKLHSGLPGGRNGLSVCARKIWFVGALWINDQTSRGLLVKRIQVDLRLVADTVFSGILLGVGLSFSGHSG